MREIIITMAVADKEALGAVRCLTGLQVAEHEGILWLRGFTDDIRLRQLPALHSYITDDDGRLFPAGKPTPTGRLPEASWQPLQTYITVSLPVSGLPGIPAQLYEVGLAPYAGAEESNALLSQLSHWKVYAETAPEIRLAHTRFAMNADGDVLILGAPLPPIPGKALVLRNNILFPAGYHFDPPAIMPLVETQLLAGKEDVLLLFDIDGSWQQLELASFVNTTRSAIRMTVNPQA